MTCNQEEYSGKIYSIRKKSDKKIHKTKKKSDLYKIENNKTKDHNNDF